MGFRIAPNQDRGRVQRPLLNYDKSKMVLVLLMIMGWSQAQAQYDYPKDRKVLIESSTLANCILLAADKFPNAKIKPAAKTYMKDFKFKPCWYEWESGGMPYLGANQSRTCEFATGKEEQLKEWILKQPDNTIDPLAIMEKSLELHDGNILTSQIAVHQLLRNNARWYSKKYYDYKSSPEDSKKFWNKFIDIRGTLKERGGKFEGDHAGSWYRFWGMSLWRTLEAYRPMIGECVDGKSTAKAPERALKNLAGQFMAMGAEGGKLLSLVFDMNYQPQLKDLMGKAKVNSMGAEVGGFFASYVANGFLDLDPAFRKKTYEKICHDKGYLSYAK